MGDRGRWDLGGVGVARTPLAPLHRRREMLAEFRKKVLLFFILSIYLILQVILNVRISKLPSVNLNRLSVY